MMTEPLLLPCPFCGSPDLAWHEEYERSGAYRSRMSIMCGCGVKMMTEHWNSATKALRNSQRNAIRARWNNRAAIENLDDE
ncbi:Lar family restriction alleviation protein [Methylobacter sp.]|uniref:Lar family restriction alleviation protein n=1 Tax=Methylobacter sp. TaxID=2051955 RepID=UPI002487850C|nr:Lar family restriction alleviation protein [Methylobacter sp.]MDI1276829.1 Lar family restriction alleviation protein [Methylobacter sp.]MDI1357495.1 Lar family restriction alleviation protein [Methylobacter sp.]